MKLRIEKSVTIITPTIGSEKLMDAVSSVENQTYSNIKHLIVVDGPQYEGRTSEVTSNSKRQIIVTPENTGANGFYGHRIYAAYPHLINSDYIFFLDEDNWYAPNHIETLVETLEQGNNFAYSLRKIYTPQKQFLCYDNCESLGKWPIYFTHNDPQYLIDTSSFAFRTDFLVQTSHLWHSGWGGDRRYFYSVKDNAKYDTNGKHTLCYRLEGNNNSVTEEFFIQGNELQKKHYNNQFPWIKQ
jgi:glycosyltransferase involved in cell wall biosynthesis